MSGIIKVDHLTKDYGEGRGIFDISFEIEEGEIYGYIGTNGSGKTTTIRNMLGFVFPDEGEIEIAGLNPVTSSADLMQKVSYIPGEIAFPNLPTGTAFLKLQAEYNGVTDFTYMNYVIKKLDLDPTANLKRMSKGMKQKTAIVAALMGDKDILILDEPTTGLDPLMRDNFLDLMRSEKEKGKTIFMSGHIFEEMEDICDRVAMIRDGHLISTLDMYSLRHDTDRNFDITFDSLASAAEFIKKMGRGKAEGPAVHIAIPPDGIDKMFKTLANYSVTQLREANITLQDAFMKEYGSDGNNEILL
ncbi:MAG: ATP-binding cassette domain-containing protein [Clostridia bacterium]|nr:ATP-binding cassette domain-containing protein [Clostridia bacterium]